MSHLFGNIFGAFTHVDAVILTTVVIWAVLNYLNLLPDIASVQKLIGIMNDRGGNLVQLLFLTIYFFKWSVWFFIYSMNKVENGNLTKDDTIMIMAITFVTGTAFGGAWGAFLKTMTGTDSQTRHADIPPTPQPMTADHGASVVVNNAVVPKTAEREEIPAAPAPAVPPPVQRTHI